MSGNTALSKVENIAELARSFPPTRSTPEQIKARLEERRQRIDAAKASQHAGSADDDAPRKMTPPAIKHVQCLTGYTEGSDEKAESSALFYLALT